MKARPAVAKTAEQGLFWGRLLKNAQWLRGRRSLNL
jgi:hypothetical protein